MYRNCLRTSLKIRHKVTGNKTTQEYRSKGKVGRDRSPTCMHVRVIYRRLTKLQTPLRNFLIFLPLIVHSRDVTGLGTRSTKCINQGCHQICHIQQYVSHIVICVGCSLSRSQVLIVSPEKGDKGRRDLNQQM